ncbi:MAG: polysaccharide biosynthesis tyrosine autokinase [Phycisphaerae bacterium]|jgi:capsular exopolysaccharide synthesis family protein
MSTVGDAQQIVQLSEAQLVTAGPAASTAPGTEGGLTFSDFGRVLKQHKLLIFIAFVVLYMMVVAATLIVWKWFPAYPARAVLQLKPPLEDVFNPTDPLVMPSIMDTLTKTEATKIYRLDVLQDALSQPEVKQTAFFRWYEGDFEECLYDLESMLSVDPIRETQLISVSLSLRNPDEAVLLVQTIVDRYLERYKQETENKGRQDLKDLEETQADVTGKLLRQREELAKFRTQTNVGALESEQDTLVRSIADQTYTVNTFDTRVADLQAQLDAVQGIDPRRLPISPEDRLIVEADPILRLYRQQVEALDVEISIARTYLAGENSRHLQMLQARRQGYYDREVARREELLDDLRERRVDSLSQELARVRAVQAQAQDQLEEQEARLKDLDSSSMRYESMIADEERLEKQLEQIDEAVMEYQHLVAAAPKAPRLNLVQRPRKAVKPSRPNVLLWLSGGVALALAGAVGLAFLRELTDKAIRTPIDVARHGRLSVLGCIPQLDDEEANVEEIEMAARAAPQSLVAEAFRQVRANLVFSGPAETQRVLLVTSPSAGNGKTTVAINLAVTLAQGNEKVLLIDCNFRRPAIRTAFKGTRPEGLSNVLIGQAQLADLITHTEVPNLDVLSSGPMPPTPADLLGPAHLRDLIQEARTRYDRVILDGPPVLLISDGLVVATQVDGVILVARAVENSKGVLKRAREQLEKVNAHIVGAVLDGVQARAGGYFRQQYREFYDYSSDETIPPELPGVPEIPAGSPDDDDLGIGDLPQPPDDKDA